MSFAIVLTSYRRPWNMADIVDACLRSARRPEVVLIDNSGTLTQEAAPEIPFGRIAYVNPGANLGAGYRFELAAGFAHDIVLCLDDDILLSAEQIDRLFGAFEAEPDRLHGVWGQQVALDADGLPRLGRGVFGARSEVDVLNRVYAFRPAQASRALRLAEELGYRSWREIGPIDDILMSFSGARRPVCESVGRFRECATSNDPQIALWRRPGFHEQRRAALAALYRRKERRSA